MSRSVLACLIAALAIAVHGMGAQTSPPLHYSGAELRRMMREAHTAEQYQKLAGYFRMRQQEFKQKADAEMKEWVRRMQNTVSLYEKYPRPAVSSRNRYEYFRYEAQRMGQDAARYERLAAGAAR